MASFDNSVIIDEKQQNKLINQFRNITETFNASKFIPTKWFGTNPHIQTIIGTGALQNKLFGLEARPFTTKEETILTKDNDFFDVEFTDNIDQAENIVIALHGLESSSKGALINRFVTAFMSKGFACVMPSFRGCEGKHHPTPIGYHVGFTQDLNQLIDIINERYPKKNIFLCGFSLGGNVALKFLGEQGENALKRNIKGAAVTCVPFDPKHCQSKIDVGINRAIYSENFLATMKSRIKKQYEEFPGYFDIDKVLSAKTIGEIDDYYISPLYGFADKFDYYAKCGSKFWLNKIRVPTVAINAIDDPFIDSNSLPTQEDVQSAPVRLIYHEYGGHCGFWADKFIVPKQLNTPNELENKPLPQHGWLAEELSRVLTHIKEEVAQIQ